MKSYIVKQKDLDSRMLSRSGGIFAAISDQVLAQGGVIYGAGMDKNFNVVHKGTSRLYGYCVPWCSKSENLE